LVVFTSSKKASLFTGVDNFGPNSLGKYQFSLLGQAYRPFSDRDGLMINGATTNQPERLSDIGAEYNYILNSYGTTASLAASHAQDNATLKQAQTTPDGKLNSIRGSINQQLILKPNHDLQFELGSQYRTSVSYQVNTNITPNASQKYKINKYSTADMGLRYLIKDQLNGRNVIHTNYTRGLSGYFKNYIDVPANLPKKHFGKMSVNLYRDQDLTKGFSAFIHLVTSHSNDILPSSELASFGGRDFGRGYDFASLEGNKMNAAAMELRYTKEMDAYYMSELQPYLYADTGHVNKFFANTNVSNLSSLGGGLRVRFVKSIDLGMEFAHPTKKNFMVNNSNITAKNRFNFFINKAFEF
ncbi:MAG: ShlB/FhaC/HecB family hemolysin secretion/activation protein, partial [Pseudomonadota bacterium]